MNDSLLEDVDDLISKHATNTQNNRYITVRKVLSPSVNAGSKYEDATTNFKQDKVLSSHSTNVSKIKINRRSGSQEKSKSKPLSSTPKADKNNPDENKAKPTENQPKVNDNIKLKPSEAKPAPKLQEKKSTKDSRRSGSSGGSSHYLDASSKENTRPSHASSSSRESATQVELKKEINRRSSDGVSKKSDILEKTDPVIFLSAIKDLVSRYTEQETIKILRAMQNLHINSQASLIKHLMLQTDEIVKELRPQSNGNSIKTLIEENERMREDIFILRTQNDVLRKKNDELSLLKEEIISLKLKLKELQK